MPTPWSYDWWVAFGIPLISAIGTIIIAATAIVISIWIAKREQADRTRDHTTAEGDRKQRASEQGRRDRSGIAPHVLTLIGTRRVEVDVYKDTRREMQRLIAAAGDASKIAEWTTQAQMELDKRRNPTDPNAIADVMWKCEKLNQVVIEWIQSGKLTHPWENWEPLPIGPVPDRPPEPRRREQPADA